MVFRWAFSQFVKRFHPHICSRKRHLKRCFNVDEIPQRSKKWNSADERPRAPRILWRLCSKSVTSATAAEAFWAVDGIFGSWSIPFSSSNGNHGTSCWIWAWRVPHNRYSRSILDYFECHLESDHLMIYRTASYLRVVSSNVLLFHLESAAPLILYPPKSRILGRK